MLTSLIITFRESLEAGLIIGIILSILAALDKRSQFKMVYWGLGLGILTSLLSAYGFSFIANGVQGVAEKLFEGIVMLVGAGFITWMVAWLSKQDISKSLKASVTKEAAKTAGWGVFFIVYTAVLREGVETVLFLNAAFFATGSSSFVGAVGGLVLAVVACVALFKSMANVPLKYIFKVTNILLALFAAGLVSTALHEFQEAGVLPIQGGGPIIQIVGFVGYLLALLLIMKRSRLS